MSELERTKKLTAALFIVGSFIIFFGGIGVFGCNCFVDESGQGIYLPFSPPCTTENFVRGAMIMGFGGIFIVVGFVLAWLTEKRGREEYVE